MNPWCCRAVFILCLFAYFPLTLGAAETETPGMLFARAASFDAHARDREAARRELAWRREEALPLLRERVQTGDSPERQAALDVLGETGGLAEEPLLLAALDDPDPFVAAHAARAAARLHRRLPLNELIDRFGYGSKAMPAGRLSGEAVALVRAAALTAIRWRCEEGFPGGSHYLPEEAVREALKHLDDPAACVRHAAASALEFLHPPDEEASSRLAARCDRAAEPEAEVRAAAVVALGRWRGREPDFFARLLREDTAAAVQVEAAGALALLRDDRGLRHLQLFYRHDAPGIRARALVIAAQLRDPFSEQGLEEALLTARRTESGGLLSGRRREAVLAARALGALQGAGMSPALRSALEDADPAVRTEAALSLARQGALGMPQRLLQNLKSEAAGARAEAARGLGLLGAPESYRALAEAAKEADPEVAVRAVWALGLLPEAETPRLGELLIELRDDARYAVSVAAREVEALRAGSKPGNEPAPTKETLRLRLQDPVW